MRDILLKKTYRVWHDIKIHNFEIQNYIAKFFFPQEASQQFSSFSAISIKADEDAETMILFWCKVFSNMDRSPSDKTRISQIYTQSMGYETDYAMCLP